MNEEQFEVLYQNFIKLHNNEGPFDAEFVMNVRDIVAGGVLLTNVYIRDEDRSAVFNATPENVHDVYYQLFKNVLRSATVSTYGPISEV